METKAFHDLPPDTKFYGDRKLAFYSEKGLRPPSSGSFTLNGVEFSPFLSTSFPTHVGYVPQTITLLDNSLAFNIALEDEPTGVLDKATACVIMAKLFAMRGHVSMIFVTHDLNLVSADRIYRVDRGGIFAHAVGNHLRYEPVLPN